MQNLQTEYNRSLIKKIRKTILGGEPSLQGFYDVSDAAFLPFLF